MKHLVIALISLIALNMLQANTLDNTIYLHKNQTNVAIYKGQQIKINDDKRKLFFQGYNSVSNTITVKDISYKVIYTKRKKIDYNISEINRIQLRLDKSLIRNILLCLVQIRGNIMMDIHFKNMKMKRKDIKHGTPNTVNPDLGG